MKNITVANVLRNISDNGMISYSLLDEDKDNIFILISPEEKYQFRKIVKSFGWKPIKSRCKKDSFLYGMDAPENFVCANAVITIFFQLACKSAMQKEWLPLDRSVNDLALKSRILDPVDGLYKLEGRYDMVYRLAKCVFTRRTFAESDIENIQNNEGLLDDSVLVLFLKKTFFKFTPILIDMLLNRDYAHIVSSCFEFNNY
jgi:hypothetical protein